MSANTSWDSLEFEKIDFSYDLSQAELSTDPRFISGLNAWVTLGGKLCKRPGTTFVDGTVTGAYRIDRLWIYETTETPPQVYLMASMYSPTFGTWSLWHTVATLGANWIQVSNIRNINQSTAPHTAAVSRGIFYAKGFPAAGQDKIGTVLFDGTAEALASGAQTRYWGIEAPTVPAALVGAVTTSSTAIDASATLLNVTNTFSLPVPFIITLDYEDMTVTSLGTGLNWTVIRGVNGTTAAAHAINTLVVWRNWRASSHQVTVNVSWAYTYAYKSLTGQVSNRAPLETNPDKLPSRTGPFKDLIPTFVIQGTLRPDLIPTIVIFRSSDGGGTYYELEEIPNTGPGNITYYDDSFESGTFGGTFNDPVPDNILDQATKAPTLTSNSVPPAVLAPQITGVNTPIGASPIAFYSGRLWYALGNVVFYSGDEEITLGIPEECWPSGLAGNFFRFQYQVVNVAATTTALYIFTVQTIYQITGTNRETFNVNPIFENYGAPYGQPRAVTSYEDSLIFLSQDYRIIRIKDNAAEVISDPLGTDVLDAVNDGAEIEIKFWSNLDKEWIMVAAWDQDDTDNSRQWVFDIKKSKIEAKPFWSVPWTIKGTAMASGRDSADTAHSQRELLFAIYDTSLGQSTVCKLDASGETASDGPDGDGYEFDVVTNVFMVPSGDHVNKFRQGAITPNVYEIALDRILFDGDTDPKISYFLDDLWTTPITPDMFEEPARRRPSKGYETIIFGVNSVCQHIAIEINKISSKERFECENLILTFAPDEGA